MSRVHLQLNSPMVSSLQDRRVSYIGHGRLESAPETLSPLHVIEHEMGHVQEFKGAAYRTNSEIRDIHVKINYEFRDGRMVAVSGETSAITQKRPEHKQTDPSLEPYSDGKSFKDLFAQSLEEDKKEGKDTKMNPQKLSEREVKEDLEAKIKVLSVKLESEKSKVTANGKDPVDVTNKNERTLEIAKEKQRLEEQVRILKMKEALKESFDILTDIRSKMISNVFGMMQIGDESKPGKLLDALI